MKTNPVKYILVRIITFSLAISACNLPQQTNPPSDIAIIVAQTQTALAVSHFLTATVPALTTPSTTPLLQTSQIESPIPEVSLTPAVPQTAVKSPTPDTTPVSEKCINAAKFEAETIPDNSVFAPDQEFIKTWTLRNVGTCTWSPNYALVFINGDQMGGTSPSPIGQTVLPGGLIQVYLPQKAPQSDGDHQGYWKLRSLSGQDFGLGKNADVAFWVKIEVVPGTTTGEGEKPFGGPQNLGNPAWTLSFDDHISPWYLGDDSGIDYDINDGRLVITAFKPTGDQWRVAQPGFLADFYLQAKFQTGSACSGTDGYGFLVRAPDQPDSVIDSGYVFSLSCDGRYRIYRMDNGNYNGIQNWTNSPTIKPGPGQTNVLGVYANGSMFKLYVNGILISELSDGAYSDGLYGPVIRSELTKDFQVYIDDVSAWIQ